MSLNSSSRIVILGGTSGIGLGVARAAAAAGAAVVVASRNPDSVAAALAELPDTASGHTVDASASDALGEFFDSVGAFDHLVYTAAGALVSTPLADYTQQKAWDFLGLRLVSALDAVRLAVPHLPPSGSITLTSGTAAFKGGTGWLLGAAASGATISAAKSLAAELAPIRVNVVAPGMTRSPLWAQVPGAEREAMYEQAGKTLPLGRVGETEDVAKAYLQLIDQDYATGVVSVVDGGALIA
jgi:NAD(P)-dependent dehydrogenase (short-subunit alcohol dehydrogenase family)